MSITPLGSPVLPLEKMMVARSSSDCGFPGAERAFEQAAGQKPEQQGCDFFAEARAGSDFFEQDLFSGDLQRKFFEQELGGDDGLQFALLRAGGDRLVRRGVIQIHGNFSAE